MSQQIAIRIPDELATGLQALVDAGLFGTKTEAIRTAITSLIESARRQGIADRIVQGYTRLPQSDEEVKAATDAAIRSIHEEPW
jgi:Arc/MetJ-type ribon-helix-helix transcriptional regulator